jgi:hypothetical protein
LAHARWKNPGANIQTLGRLMRLPPAAANAMAKTIVEGAVEELLGERADAKAFAELIALDAPMDVVVVFDISRGGPVPEPLKALSVGLTSIGRARDASRGRPHKLADGVWRVGPPAQPWENVCAIAASSGKTPARLVCSESERELMRVVSYTARNVPMIADPPSDLHMQVNFRPLLDKFGRKWANEARALPVFAKEFEQGVPRFDNALRDAATALANEAGGLINDADKIVVDATINESEGMMVNGNVAFAGKKSWIVQTLLDGADLAGPAPDLFWYAPASSENVTYARFGDPKRYEEVLSTTRLLVEGFLEREKVASGADRKAIAKLLRLPFKKGAATVFASGHFPPSGTQRTMTQEFLDAAFGWQLLGVEDGPAELKAWLEDFVSAYNRAGFQTYLKKESGPNAKLPVVKKGKAPEGMAGATTVEIRVPDFDDAMGPPPAPGKAAPRPKEVVFHVLLLPDGQRTWVGLASDRDALGKLMKGLKGQKPGPEAIAGRGDLAMFKSGKHSSGGFTTLDGMMKAMLWLFVTRSPGGGNDLAQFRAVFERMPHKGATPITIFNDVNAGARPQVTFNARWPRESLADVGFLLQQAAAQGRSRP